MNPSSSLFNALAINDLIWLPVQEIGWYPVKEMPYDRAYWAKYRAMDETIMGTVLTKVRIDLVNKYWAGPLVDVGIGGGRFVSKRHLTSGYDVNPAAIDWLQDQELWFNPYASIVDAVSFWDSLEHIHDPRPLLCNVRHFVFCSLPIFTGPEHILKSKHFRPDEHCWYFTDKGFRTFMAALGFTVVASNTMETELGREDVRSYVLKRHEA